MNLNSVKNNQRQKIFQRELLIMKTVFGELQ